MVERTVDSDDARASRAALTDTGAERLGEATSTAEAQASRLLSARLDAREIRQLDRLLSELAPATIT